ncbi:RagB/SusD family nutrient uptake outer membrane protein [Parabacteroides distasonis]
MPINVRNSNGKLVNYSCELYGVTPNFQYNNTQDVVILRFADVLLMGAELGGPKAQAYLDQVRSRVNLPSVPATLENIKKERLYELAYEGVRYYDLMRWGDLEKEVNRMKKDVPVKTMGVDGTITIQFRKETRGFLPIPEDEIQLSNGSLVQNPGWDTPDAFYQD